MEFKGSLKLDWINKHKSLYYEIDESESRGIRPVWVDRNDIRVTEPRPLILKGVYGDEDTDNMLIRGDNLLALRRLVQEFKYKDEKDKVKCVYIDPPYNTQNAFEHYDDNLKHSEWLTMMRDRLILIYELLRKDGFLFVHIDNGEFAYLKVLLDEIFGRNNFLNQIAYERSGSAGIGQGASFLLNTTEYILVYVKDKKSMGDVNAKEYKLLEKKTMQRYNKILKSTGNKKLIKQFNAKSNGKPVKIYKHYDYEIETISLANFKKRENEIRQTYLDEFYNIYRTTNPQEENTFQNELISYMDKDCLYSVEYIPSRGKNKGKLTTNYYYNKEIFAWLSDSAEIKDDRVVKTNKMTDFWRHEDIPKANLANEGGVKLKRSKKPEALIKRILEISTEEGDLVLDSFAGSGTTAAVAHKMKRKWIAIELGEHAETLCLKRLLNVIDRENPDNVGISKEVNWKGGGGFKYYELGPSIINEKDLNWELDKKELSNTILQYFEYSLIYEENDMFFGVKLEKGLKKIAICNISPQIDIVTESKFFEIIEFAKKKFDFDQLTFFTNKGVEVQSDSLDEKILIRKLPNCILE